MEITFKNLELAESIPKTPSEFIEKTPKKGANIQHKNSIVKDNEAVNAAFDYLKSQVEYLLILIITVETKTRKKETRSRNSW